MTTLTAGQVLHMLMQGRWGSLLFSGLVLNLGLLVVPLFAMLVFDKVMHNGIFETLWALAIGAVLFLLMELTLRQSRARGIERLARKLDRRIDQQLLVQLLARSGRSAAQPGMAARMLTVYRDLAQAREFFSATFVLALADVPFLIGIGLVVGLVGWPLLVVLVTWLTIYAVTGLWMRRRSARLVRHALQRQSAKMAFLTDVMSSLDVMRTSAGGERAVQRFEALAADAADATGRVRLEALALQHWTQAVYFLSYISLIVAGAYLVFHQHLTLGALIAVSMLSGRAMGVTGQALLTLGRWDELRQCAQVLKPFVGGHDIVQRSVLSPDGGPIDPVVSPGDGLALVEPLAGDEALLRRAPSGVRGEIVLRDIVHCFGDAPEVLRGLGLRIAPGERVGILGRPGSGKSTLLRVVSGAIAPTQGLVTVDDIALDAIHPRDRHEWLSFKPQETALVAGTLEAVVLSNLPVEVTPQERLEALRFALHGSTLAEDIQRGALTLDRPIEEFGANLSGGQRQKVAIARALATRPRILLLDEPNAGLDTDSERLLAERLRSLAGVSIVVVSHSSVMLALTERLVVLERGRVIGDGATKDLLVSAKYGAS